LPGGDVTLDTDENHHTSIRCGRSSFRVSGMPASDFPRDADVEDTWTFVMPGTEFRRILTKVSYATSNEESRQVLHGILLSLRGGVLTAAATDGKRLALVEKPLNVDGVPDGDVILPPKVVGELERLVEGDGDLCVRLTEARAVFQHGSILLTSKLIEGTYPNYRQVVPAQFTSSAVIPRQMLADVLNRVSMVASDTSGAVKLELAKASLTLSATSTEFGDASEPFDVSYDGDPLVIAFNPVFLADPLPRLEAEQIVFQFNDQYSPVCLSGDEGFIYILMPMRT
jgi:DNA polymerase-3 subunit beta